jgi:two-component system chemotaxis response regulator CheB
MDVFMPEMDGFEATRQIMTEAPCPVVIISASTDKDQRDLTFNALRAGALSVLEKPTLQDPPEIYEALVNQVRLMSEVKVLRRWSKPTDPLSPPSPGMLKPQALPQDGRSRIRLVAIAASTGGPGILAEILSRLPANFPAPILIVQHITPGFGVGLADWLNQQTPLQVRLARHADEPKAGQVLIAPDGVHMVVNSMGLIALTDAPPLHSLRPAADYLLHSVARIYGSTAIGIVLTGMGSDGAEGLQAMYRAGARTIAQDKETCIVFGMPAVAIELGAAEQVLPAKRIAAAIMELI